MLEIPTREQATESPLPLFSGTCIGFHHVAAYARYFAGDLERVRAEFPHLTLHQIKSAIRYCELHPEQFDEALRAEAGTPQPVAPPGGSSVFADLLRDLPRNPVDRIRALRGRFAGYGRSSEELLREKHAETAHEYAPSR